MVVVEQGTQLDEGDYNTSERLLLLRNFLRNWLGKRMEIIE